ncbi:hypothetical protein NKR23_g7639 [Pleurostoma richardsiae]|uniref:CENP-V/GFA domain-containing protein n=1 Tax=Pleurostoma richardsiae TaxID=41990 RepID=A0AA38RBD7_9PEZI|nr:hypothetical protein NKR23_g7639 [Pleurostoma richardsiae]
MSSTEEPQPKPSATYEAGCHCGYIKFATTISPPLPEHKVLNCDCSACRRFGYLLVYPAREEVEWHGDSLARCARYQFNTKEKDHLFCPKCGASLMIDFREFYANDEKPWFGYGVSVRTFNGIDLDTLTYKKFKGSEKVKPAGDLSGMWYNEDEEEKAKAAQ